MNKKNTQALLERYPRLYQEHAWGTHKSCMASGFSCGDGWYELIDTLSAAIEAESAHLPEEARPRAAQVKEKFGHLRFYLHGTVPDAVRELVARATEASATICEMCGEPGVMRHSRPWIRPLCDVHEAERLGEAPA